MKTENPAFVLGLFETGLGVARSLGRNGIRVFGFDKEKDIGFYSRYVNAKICPDPNLQEKEFIEFLINETKKFNVKPVLFLTSDDVIQIISANLGILEKYFLINLPAKNIIDSINNKYLQYQLAVISEIDVPKTMLVEDKADIQKIISELTFPLFIKGLESNEWRKVFGGSKKGFVFYNSPELLKQADYLLTKGIKLIAQELIIGNDTNHYKFCGYVDKNKKLIAGFCLRKIRQNPVHFGVGCLVESIKNEQLKEIGSRFFEAIQYSGVGSAEFKLDEKDGRYKLIELNPRYWQQNTLAEFCGINFPLIQYLDLTNQQLPKNFDYEAGRKWINIYSDFDSFLSYRKEGILNIKTWIKSLQGKKVFSDYAKDDLLPSFFEIRFGKKLFNIPKYLLKKLFSQ